MKSEIPHLQHLTDPDDVGSAEYRELFELLEGTADFDEAIAVCETMEGWSSEARRQLVRHQAGRPSDGFDVWSEDLTFGRAAWKSEVANGDTNQGYWEWVDHQKEQQADEQHQQSPD